MWNAESEARFVADITTIDISGENKENEPPDAQISTHIDSTDEFDEEFQRLGEIVPGFDFTDQFDEEFQRLGEIVPGFDFTDEFDELFQLLDEIARDFDFTAESDVEWNQPFAQIPPEIDFTDAYESDPSDQLVAEISLDILSTDPSVDYVVELIEHSTDDDSVVSGSDPGIGPRDLPYTSTISPPKHQDTTPADEPPKPKRRRYFR